MTRLRRAFLIATLSLLACAATANVKRADLPRAARS
jgi:hypothetical protein